MVSARLFEEVSLGTIVGRSPARYLQQSVLILCWQNFGSHIWFSWKKDEQDLLQIYMKVRGRYPQTDPVS